MPDAPVVAVLNSNDDTVELIRAWFENAGLLVVSAHLDNIKRGETDLSSFVDTHKPKVVVLDIAPPYERSWLLADHLRSSSPLAGLPFVFTTTNEQRVREFVRDVGELTEIVGKPYDLDQVLARVRQHL
jgi:CheY-like chemotaxis protein